MYLSDLIEPNFIHIDKRFNSVDEILKFVSVSFASKYPAASEEIYRLLLEREKVGPTSICDGVIIPHARVKDVDDIFIEIFRLNSESEIHYGDNDSVLRYVFAIITSCNLPVEYLKVFKAITELVRSHLQKLDTARTNDEVFNRIKNLEITVEEHLVARDISSSAIAIPSDYPISDAIDLMKQKQVEHLAVIDEYGMFKGVIDFVDLLKSSFPSYVFTFENLSFISEFEPLREFLSHETTGTVAQYVTKEPFNEIVEDESYVDVVYEFVKRRLRYMYVTKDGKLVGVITVRDLISKLFRA